MFKAPEKYRILLGRLGSTSANGNNGAFMVPSVTKGRVLFIIASAGLDWEHVSVHSEMGSRLKTPHWDEMCQVKDLFWDEEDIVMQLHPAKSDYVNCHPNTLHLWRPIGIEIHHPESFLVGGGLPNKS